MLDNAGFRTGYIFRNPLIKGDVPKPRNDIEVPPAVSSLGYLIEEEELFKQGYVAKRVTGSIMNFEQKKTIFLLFSHISAFGVRVIRVRLEIALVG